MKKFLAILLTLTLLIPCVVSPAHAAGDEEKIVGRWETEIDFAPIEGLLLDAMLGAVFAQFVEDPSALPSFSSCFEALPASVYLEFDQDGTVKSGLVDEEGDMEKLNKILEDGITVYFTALCEYKILDECSQELGKTLSTREDLEKAAGMSLDEICERGLGMSFDEYVAAAMEENIPAGTDFAEELDLRDILSIYEWEGTYTVLKNGKLLFDSDPTECLYAGIAPYYDLTKNTLLLYLSDDMDLADMDMDDLKEFDENVEEMFESFLGSQEDLEKVGLDGDFVIEIARAFLGLFYDLSFTRA